jgi:hypothetical protein
MSRCKCHMTQHERDLDHEWKSGLMVGAMVTALVLLFIFYVLARTGVIH